MKWILCLLYCVVSVAVAKPCKTLLSKQTYQKFVKLGAHWSQQKQTDFGRLYHTQTCYLSAAPNNTAQAAALIKLAYKNNITLRSQGDSHSQNGSSLPQHLELLLSSDQLNTITFSQVNAVKVGAGLPVFFVNKDVQHFSSFQLPTPNEGGFGPSVGGFISSGGISYKSVHYGGFWQHVNKITLVTGNGKVLKVTPKSPLFLWLFGSMGQLGFITAATLDVVPQAHRHFHWPWGLILKVKNHYAGGTYWTQAHTRQPLYWFNLFVPKKELLQASLSLKQLEKKYPKALTYIPFYQWPIRVTDPSPPLLYPHPGSFNALGLWGGKGTSPQQFFALAKAFTHLVKQNHYNRYIQAEMPQGPTAYANYFDKSIYQQFYNWKKKLDPKLLFNSGSVFKQHH